MFVRTRRPKNSPAPRERRGAVLVEVALVSSVFGLFLAGIMEFGHAYMVIGAMDAAARRGARYGAVDGVTNTDVNTLVNTVLNAAFKASKATVVIKDGSIFDTSNVNPKTIDYSKLPDLDLSQATTHQLYIVRITVPYNNVALLPPFWVKNLTLHAQAVMRHE